MNVGSVPRVDKRKGRFRKIIVQIHLWLGLLSGLIVFVIVVTGCIYAFQAEIKDLTQPFRHVQPQNQVFLTPSQIRKITDAKLPGKHPHALLYGKNDRAAQVIYYSGIESIITSYFLIHIRGKY